MAYSTFLLDLDHTLLDSDASEDAAYMQTMLAAGVSEPQRFRQAYKNINLELWAGVERGELKPQQVRSLRFERLLEQAGIDADPQAMADDFVAGLAAFGELYAGAFEVLEALSRSASLALVTNGLSEVQRARIERLGIGHLFDAVVISAEVGVAKPGTEIFELTFEALQRPAREAAVMVGDNLSSDIAGGANYGIATCWFNPAGSVAGQDSRITHEISALEELLGLVAH